MKKFNRGDGFDNRDKGRPKMHNAVCASCGRNCEVPFRPTGDRPVYCSDCFKNIGGQSQRRNESGDFRRQSNENKRMHKAVCASCGRNCEVPFRPTEGKPVYCDDCFGKKDNQGSRKSDRPNEQFAALNAKLDKIIDLLSGAVIKKEKKSEIKSTEKKPATKKSGAKKPKAKKKK